MKWVGVCYYGLSEILPQNIIAKVKAFGGNAIRIYFIYKDYTSGNYKAILDSARQQCREQGVAFIISSHGDTSYLMSDASYDAVLNNVGGAGDQWINDAAAVVEGLQPDAFELMNEPHGTVDFSVYRAFCVRLIDTLLTVKPDLTLLVDGYPFWTALNSWKNNPLPYSNLYYVIHYHYAGTPATWMNDPLSAEMLNPYYNGDLVNATRLQEEYFVNTQGLGSLPVIFAESGVDKDLPHWDAWLLDLYALATKYDSVGFLQHVFRPDSSEPKMGLLLNDWATLNAVGTLFFEYHPPITPPICAPGYHWDETAGACVPDEVTPPPKPKTFGARTIGPFGVPSALLHQLWILRERTIRKEVHKKLHPLV